MKPIRLWLATIATLLCSITASAYDFEADGIYYNIISASDLTVEVTSGDDNYNSYSGDIIIPSTINDGGKTMIVTSIGGSAFFGCSGLTSITIPSTVTSINPFQYCDGLDKIVVESGNTVYDSRDNCNAIIETNSNTLIVGSKTTNIPNSVTSIGDYAFYGCGSLTTITIPNSVTSIGRSAFYDCSGLTSVIIPNSVTSIGDYAFENCSRLTNATIPNSVTGIGDRAFAFCPGLTSITIPNSVECIGNGAFLDTGWWNKQQDGLIYIDGWLIGYKVVSPVFDIVIQDGTRNVANYALYDCSGITSITIPNSVTSIGKYAFANCSGLTSIIIPDGITSIREHAFWKCSGLTSVTIPNSVTDIGERAFGDCNAIEKLELNCPTIESWFRDNQSIKEVIIGNSVTSVGNSAFSGCSGLTNIAIPNSITSIGDYAFYGCSELTSITIPNSVTSIGENAFDDCNAIEKLELNCPKIDSWFRGNQSIKEVTLGNSVTSIGDYAFDGCRSLTTISIPNSVTIIGRSAFYSCSGLTSVSVPNSVTSIGEYAFYGCNAIEKLELNCLEIRSWFSGNQSIKEVTLGSSVTSIGEYAFYGYSGLTSVSIPNSVTSIRKGAFGGCSELTDITIPNSVTSIGEYAFENCSRLTKITIPNSVARVGEGAFEGTAWYNNQPDGIVYAGKVLYKYKGTMPENTNITIEDGTLVLAGGAFQYCYGLIGITIPNSVLNIGKNAFWYCYALRKINSFIPAEELFVPDDNAFEGVNKETCTLYVPEGDVSAYESTAGWNEFEHIVEFKPYYTITYRVDGEVYATETIEYGSEIILIDEPVREGHTFSGWSEVPETMPTNDVTVEGSFTVNNYILTYIIDGSLYKEESIAYGTVITMLEAPEKLGYTFDGWDKTLTIMPAEDVVINGSYTRMPIENYTISDSDKCFAIEDNLQCNNITYTRIFSNTNWQALYVPYEIPVTEDFLEDFEIADLNDVHQYDRDNDGVKDETVIEAFKMTSGTLEANYPYLIRAKEAGEKSITVTDAALYATEENSIDCSSVRDKFTFTGTYSSLSSAELPQGEGYYTLIEGEWNPVTEAVALGAFRFYLKVDSRSGTTATEARSIRMRIIGENGEDDTTGIDNLGIRNHQSEIIYDLQGRRVENPTKGFYIVNGRKVVIK